FLAALTAQLSRVATPRFASYAVLPGIGFRLLDAGALRQHFLDPVPRVASGMAGPVPFELRLASLLLLPVAVEFRLDFIPASVAMLRARLPTIPIGGQHFVGRGIFRVVLAVRVFFAPV